MSEANPLHTRSSFSFLPDKSDAFQKSSVQLAPINVEYSGVRKANILRGMNVAGMEVRNDHNARRRL